MTKNLDSIPIECPKCDGDSGFTIIPTDFAPSNRDGDLLCAFAKCNDCGCRVRVRGHGKPSRTQDWYPEIFLNPDEPETKDTNPKDAVGVRKAPLSTVPAPVLLEIGLAMLEGARKYGRHNYRATGIGASVYYDAAMRHLTAWWEGEDLDPDSGLHHVVKALASLVVLRDAMRLENLEDDRPPRSPPEWLPMLNFTAGKIVDRLPEPKEPHTHAGTLRLPEGGCAVVDGTESSVARGRDGAGKNGASDNGVRPPRRAARPGTVPGDSPRKLDERMVEIFEAQLELYRLSEDGRRTDELKKRCDDLLLRLSERDRIELRIVSRIVGRLCSR